ncbi:MAG: ribonuclease M5 [Tissierellales bacterium]|nr:ribonuclease M5 [Tissierellales bacterium]
MIKEVIVVEGKDDIAKVKSAIECECIATNGFAYGKKFINILKKIDRERGIIIFTDPDYQGEKIRRELKKLFPNAKHAFLSQEKALKDGDIGIENANKEDIIEAISKVRPTMIEKEEIFTVKDMIANNLANGNGAKYRREQLGNILGIGYANSKTFLERLNAFGVTKEEFIDALKRIDNNAR